MNRRDAELVAGLRRTPRRFCRSTTQQGDEMRLSLRAGTVCGLLTCAVLLAASAASAAGLDGLARARAAGIAVDPGAEKLMQQARAGSCFNDPTQAMCPH